MTSTNEAREAYRGKLLEIIDLPSIHKTYLGKDIKPDSGQTYEDAKQEAIESMLFINPVERVIPIFAHLPYLLRELAENREYEYMLYDLIDFLDTPQYQHHLYGGLVLLGLSEEEGGFGEDEIYDDLCTSWFYSKQRKTENPISRELLRDTAFQEYAAEISAGYQDFLAIMEREDECDPASNDAHTLSRMNFYKSHTPLKERLLEHYYHEFCSLIEFSVGDLDNALSHPPRESITGADPLEHLEDIFSTFDMFIMNLNSSLTKSLIPAKNQFLRGNRPKDWPDKARKYFLEMYTLFVGYYIYNTDNPPPEELRHLREYATFIGNLNHSRNRMRFNRRLESL